MTGSFLPVPSFNRLDSSHLADLRAVVGEGFVLAEDSARERYGKDETEALSFAPEAAVLPGSAGEVASVLRLAARERIPVTPRGAGTGLSGGALPVCGGIVLSLERLDRIRAIDRRGMTVEAEAGVITGELQRSVEELGLFYPPDPASRENCTLGGNWAEDAAGPRSCKYGTTRRWILGLEAVGADGALFHTGGAIRKDAAGYSLTQLLIGSEGTLAVLTAATLRLMPLPKARLTLVLPFAALETAAAAVEAICRRDEPAACEILDGPAFNAVAALEPLPGNLRDLEALLLLELDGEEPEALLRRAADLAALAEELGGGEALLAQEAADQRRLWLIRRRVGEAVKQHSVYKEADTVVPRPALADLVRAARQACERHGIRAICYGHAADGNLHINLLRGDLGDLEPAAWEERRDAAEDEIFRAAAALGGKITGEHGVGWTQRRHLPLCTDPGALQRMRAIKQALDPHGILNPGKIFT